MKKESYKHICCLFDYHATTGFGTISQNIVAYLRKHFGDRLKLDIIAINFFGQHFMEDSNTHVWPAIHTPDAAGRFDEFGRHPFLSKIANGNYDGIFILQDIGIIEPIIDTLGRLQNEKIRNKKKKFKSVFYFPVDGPPVKKWFDNLDFFDEVIVYTDYAKQEIVWKNPSLISKIRIIPHGINLRDFHPLEEKKTRPFRKEYFKGNADKFIINAGNRNQPRKDFPTLIFSFLKYREQYNRNAFLYLHCNPTDYMGYNLPVIMEQVGLRENIDFAYPPEAYYDAGASSDILNHIINASDVYLTTTSGEGWGMFPHQCAGCKIPVIAPYNTSLMEMSGQGKWFFSLKKQSPAINHFDSMLRYRSDPDEVAAVLHQVCTDKEEVARRVELAYGWATSLSWHLVIKRWIDIFENTFFKD